MEKHIEEFTQGNQAFVHIDFKDIKNNEAFLQVIEESIPIIQKYPPKSIYTITDIKGVRYDTETKRIIAQWMTDNDPYVIDGVVIGVDGIKKIMVNSILAMSGRTNVHFATNKEEAVRLLLAH